MADISLHFSSKAPLAGTFTAFNQIFATWRRRNRERQMPDDCANHCPPSPALEPAPRRWPVAAMVTVRAFA